jgi:hypothetical protein
MPAERHGMAVAVMVAGAALAVTFEWGTHIAPRNEANREKYTVTGGCNDRWELRPHAAAGPAAAIRSRTSRLDSVSSASTPRPTGAQPLSLVAGKIYVIRANRARPDVEWPRVIG